MIQDYLDAASDRANERPGWAGIKPAVPSRATNGDRPPPARRTGASPRRAAPT